MTLAAWSPCFDYILMVSAASGAMYHLFSSPPFVVGDERLRMQAFIFSSLDAMMSVARLFPGDSFPEESLLVGAAGDAIEHPLAPSEYVTALCVDASEFVAALRARWTAAPFQAMLRSRELVDDNEEYAEKLRTRCAADVAAHGLHPCGLPSCDQREAAVKQFKCYGDCEEEWYCCAEHQILHWKEHKPICRARAAAAALATTTLE